MDCISPGFPVLHYLLEFAQTHVHWVGDAIQSSHHLLPASAPALSLFHTGSFPMSWLFTSGGQSTGASASASVLPVNIQGWFPLGLTDLISWQSKGLLRIFYSTTIWSINSLALSLLYGPTLTSEQDNWKYHSFAYMGLYTRSIIYQMWKNIYLRKHVQHSYIYNIMKQI